MVGAGPERDFTAKVRQRTAPRGFAGAGSAAAPALRHDGDRDHEGNREHRVGPESRPARTPAHCKGKSSVIASCTSFILIGLASTIRRSMAGSLSFERGLAGAEQDQGDQVVPVLVGLLVHVDEGVDRLLPQAVGVEDDGVGRRLPVSLRRPFGVADQEHAIAHAGQVLPQGVLDLDLGLDAEHVLTGSAP